MPSSDSTTLISTSSGSERRACFPAASRPCQLKSWACALATVATHSSAAISRLRTWTSEPERREKASIIRLVDILELPAVGPRILARGSGRVLRGILRRILGCIRGGVFDGVRGHAAGIEAEARVRIGVFVVVAIVLVMFVLPIDPILH